MKKILPSDHIFTVDNENENTFLRGKTTNIEISDFSQKEIRALVSTMRKIMRSADGVGLSANQIGLPINMFVAEVDHTFYAIFNPKIVKKSKEIDEQEEGCLSVPERFGMMRRHEKITLEGYTQTGKKIKIKAWGFLARVFQHEVDHLQGSLFSDSATNMRHYSPPQS